MKSNSRTKAELRYGDDVMIPWGSTEVRGRVAEVYGPRSLRRVVVVLEPEVSSYVVAEPTTVVFPLGDVRKVGPLPEPLRIDAEVHAILRHAAQLLGVSREEFASAAVCRLAAEQGIELEDALLAATAPLDGSLRSEASGLSGLSRAEIESTTPAAGGSARRPDGVTVP